MTNTPNPYAPPVAVVADITPADGAAFQPVKIFGAKGRIGRLRYFAYLVGGGGVVIFTGRIVAWTVKAILGASFFAAGSPNAASIVTIAVWSVTMLFYLIFGIITSIQRGHDMNLSGRSVLTTLNPLAGLFRPGTEGVNRFGLPPAPNSTGVKIVAALIIPASFIITAVALLIALNQAIPD